MEGLLLVVFDRSLRWNDGDLGILLDFISLSLGIREDCFKFSLEGVLFIRRGGALVLRDFVPLATIASATVAIVGLQLPMLLGIQRSDLDFTVILGLDGNKGLMLELRGNVLAPYLEEIPFTAILPFLKLVVSLLWLDGNKGFLLELRGKVLAPLLEEIPFTAILPFIALVLPLL